MDLASRILREIWTWDWVKSLKHLDVRQLTSQDFSVLCGVLSTSVTDLPQWLPEWIRLILSSKNCAWYHFYLSTFVPPQSSLFMWLQLHSDAFETGFSMSLLSSIFPFIQTLYVKYHPRDHCNRMKWVGPKVSILAAFFKSFLDEILSWWKSL